MSAQLDALEAHLDDIELRLARQASHEAVERLQRAYGYYIDKGLWSAAADLFAADGTWEYGQGGVYRGPARIAAALGLRGPEGLLQGDLNTNFICQGIITIAPDNLTAKVFPGLSFDTSSLYLRG